MQGAGVCFCRSPVGIVHLSAYQDACSGKVGGGTAFEPEGNAGPCMGGAEGGFTDRTGGKVGQRIAEGCGESLHHASVDFSFRKLRHPFRHDGGVVAGSSHMVVCDAPYDRFAEAGEVAVEFGDVVPEQRLFHRYEFLRSLDDVARVAEGVIGIIDVQFEIVEVVHFEASFVLCHGCNR